MPCKYAAENRARIAKNTEAIEASSMGLSAPVTVDTNPTNWNGTAWMWFAIFVLFIMVIIALVK